MDSQISADEQLLDQIAAGDTEALSQIVDRYQEIALSLAFRHTQNWTDAEDIAQEAFLRVFKSATKYKGDSTFKTWFYRIVVNLCLDNQKKDKPKLSLDMTQAEDLLINESNPLEQNEIAKIVQKAVYELPERQRIALILHRYEELSHSQISQSTGWSRSAVESLLVRAYENLRNKLEKYRNI